MLDRMLGKLIKIIMLVPLSNAARVQELVNYSLELKLLLNETHLISDPVDLGGCLLGWWCLSVRGAEIREIAGRMRTMD